MLPRSIPSTSRMIDYLCGVNSRTAFWLLSSPFMGGGVIFDKKPLLTGFFIIFKMDLSFLFPVVTCVRCNGRLHAWATRGEWWSRMWDHLIDEDHKVGCDDMIRRWFLLGQKGSLLFVLWERSQNSLWWREKDIALCLFFRQVSSAKNPTCKYAT